MVGRGPQIVLASSSPRRRELLDQIGVGYKALSVDLDETIREAERPERYVERIAAEKSEGALQLGAGGLPVLGADTAVVLDGVVMGKPRGREEAFDMLARLSGRRHTVLSAVSLRAAGGRHWQALSETSVSFRIIQPIEMRAYWETGEPADKAGGYAIQGLGAVFVKSIHGSFSGVVGLPLYETSLLLKEAGIFSLQT
ncbi:MAG: Maf family protein [Pseudomonadota bacterium]